MKSQRANLREVNLVEKLDKPQKILSDALFIWDSINKRFNFKGGYIQSVNLKFKVKIKSFGGFKTFNSLTEARDYVIRVV